MPPKARVTKDMVIDAAFEVARQTGAENISARTVSEKLNCSTQPVMYHFATIEALKKAAYAKADRFHTEYLMNAEPHNIMLCIGLNYIRFAVEEPHLFRFLFQSGFSTKNNFLEMVRTPNCRIYFSVPSGMETLPTLEKETVAAWAAMRLAHRSTMSFRGSGAIRAGKLCSRAQRLFIWAFSCSAVSFS